MNAKNENEDGGERDKLIPIPIITKEEYIPLGERIVTSIYKSLITLCHGVISILISPIVFFQVLFTSRRKTRINISQMKMPGQNGPMNINFKRPPSDDDEDWKKEHLDQYGDDYQ